MKFDRFHRCCAHEKQRRVTFNIGEEEVKKLEHVDLMTSGLAQISFFGDSNSYVGSSGETLGSSQEVGVVRRYRKILKGDKVDVTRSRRYHYSLSVDSVFFTWIF